MYKEGRRIKGEREEVFCIWNGRLCGVGGGAERRRAAGSVSPKDDVVCVAARGGEQLGWMKG